ncbi:MAG: hypothetical protein Q8K82_12670 [Gemmatimonadaceae bacterium]|nr:hypothetical protein [Gemmatimonadaceae bacterium]
MRKSWPAVPLGEVVRHRKEFVTIDDLKTYRRPRVQLHANGVVLRDELPGALIKTKAQQVCRAGELLVAEIDAKHGGYGMVPPELDGAIVSSHYFLFVPDERRLDPAYLHFFTKTAFFRDQVEAQGSTNYAAIRPGHVLSYVIPLLPLDEQRRIVARIETVANALTRIEDLQSEVAALSDTTVLSLHHTFAAGAARHLRDLIELYEVAVDVESSASYPQVGVRSFGAGLFPKAATLGSSTTYKRFNTLYEGAIVLSQVKGWEGALALCPSELAGWFVSPEYRTFRCRDSEVVPEYIGRMIRTAWFWNKLQAATRGVGARRERTRPEQFLDIELTMPTVRDQQRALAVIERLQKVDSLRKSTQPQRAALLPAILDRAFKGEL